MNAHSLAMTSMTSFDQLAKAMQDTDGLVLMSIRVPLNGKGWIVTKRYGEAAWKYGTPHETLAEALNTAFPAPPATDLDDLF